MNYKVAQSQNQTWEMLMALYKPSALFSKMATMFWSDSDFLQYRGLQRSENPEIGVSTYVYDA